MDDEVILKQPQKKRLVIDDDQEGPPTRTVTTKVTDDKPARDNYDHKTNGDKPKEAKKPLEKKEESKTSKPDPKASPAKPKPASDKDPKAVKSNTDQKPPAKPKPAGEDKKPAEANGQTQKKPTEGSKPPAKPVNKKKEESESGSDSEDSAEESDSEDERRRKKKEKEKKDKPKPKPKPEAKPKKESKEVSKDGPKKIVRKKETLVYDVLKRWWYALPDWPPAGYDYSAELAKNKLRKVDPKYFRKENETDANGNRKVFEMPAYSGLFKDSSGEIHDLRPRDSCPCYDVFKKKSILELCGLLATALKNQVEALEKSPVVDPDLLKHLKVELKEAEKSYEAQKAKAAE